jgi:hypothetical protein
MRRARNLRMSRSNSNFTLIPLPELQRPNTAFDGLLPVRSPLIMCP